VKGCCSVRCKIDRKVAESVAEGMKTLGHYSMGATHYYALGFKPLTGSKTAEKHDAFFDFSRRVGLMEKFGGGAKLVQQESDAQFPQWGFATPFESRGIRHGIKHSPAFLYGAPFGIPTFLWLNRGP